MSDDLFVKLGNDHVSATSGITPEPSEYMRRLREYFGLIIEGRCPWCTDWLWRGEHCGWCSRCHMGWTAQTHRHGDDCSEIDGVCIFRDGEGLVTQYTDLASETAEFRSGPST